MSVACEGTVSKFAMGRSTGISIKNWKTRHLVLTKEANGGTLQYGEAKGTPAKHVMNLNAISVLWTRPTPKDHPKADPAQPMFMIRVWSNGVFDLLVNCITPLEKEKWVTALKEALSKNKGLQVL